MDLYVNSLWEVLGLSEIADKEIIGTTVVDLMWQIF